MDNQSMTALIVVIAVIVALIFVWLLLQRRKSQGLRAKFGDEYQRTVDERGGKAKAEADLLEREERVKKLDIRPLGPAERDEFQTEWTATKALFVDSPNEAVSRGDRLLGTVMKARGYPVTDFEHRHADLTVEHGDVAERYRTGHEIADRAGRGDATTEELRQAMTHYEQLFDRLVSDTGDSVAARPVSAPAQR